MKKLNHKRLAEGEVTGHSHVATAVDAEIFAENETSDDRVLVANNGTDIVHEEHGTRTLPPGQYNISKQLEFDPFEEEIRKVKD